MNDYEVNVLGYSYKVRASTFEAAIGMALRGGRGSGTKVLTQDGLPVNSRKRGNLSVRVFVLKFDVDRRDPIGKTERLPKYVDEGGLTL